LRFCGGGPARPVDDVKAALVPGVLPAPAISVSRSDLAFARTRFRFGQNGQQKVREIRHDVFSLSRENEWMLAHLLVLQKKKQSEWKKIVPPRGSARASTAQLSHISLTNHSNSR
jgi:hypothetical protein